MAMAESLSKWKGIVPLEYFDTLNPDGTNKFSKEWHLSYNGKVCYLEPPYGVLKFQLHTSIHFVFFAFDNVFADKGSEFPVKPNSINKGQMYNFHVLPVPLPTLNKIKCFHGGLLWKNSKPVKILNVTLDCERAVSILRNYFTSLNNAPVPAKTPAPVAAPPRSPAQVKEVLSGQTGIVWKAINNDEGLMFLRKTKGGQVIWFNRSNLEKVQARFNHLNELVGVPLHFDAELLHAPANPSEYVWYQGTAFWDSGRLRPSIPNGVVGLKIFNYEPKSDFSLRLKRAVEFALKNPFSYDKIDNVFRDLANARLFKDVSSPPKKEVAPDGKEGPALQKKEVNHLLDTIKKLSEDVKTLKIVNTDRRTSFSGFSEDWKAKSCVSLPNEVKNETHVPKTGIQAGYKYVQPYEPIDFHVRTTSKKEESRSNFMFPAPVNNVKEESLVDDMIKNTLRNSLRDEAVMPESLMTKIVDNFCKRLNKEMLVGVNNNKTGKTKTKDKSTQTVSTGKVIYLKIHPA